MLFVWWIGVSHQHNHHQAPGWLLSIRDGLKTSVPFRVRSLMRPSYYRREVSMTPNVLLGYVCVAVGLELGVDDLAFCPCSWMGVMMCLLLGI